MTFVAHSISSFIVLLAIGYMLFLKPHLIAAFSPRLALNCDVCFYALLVSLCLVRFLNA
jgi:hypothetical protein